MLNTEALLDQAAAMIGEMAVATNISLGHRLRDVKQFLAGDEWLVKRDVAGRLTLQDRSSFAK
jgi:hypothetical protein